MTLNDVAFEPCEGSYSDSLITYQIMVIAKITTWPLLGLRVRLAALLMMCIYIKCLQKIFRILKPVQNMSQNAFS